VREVVEHVEHIEKASNIEAFSDTVSSTESLKLYKLALNRNIILRVKIDAFISITNSHFLYPSFNHDFPPPPPYTPILCAKTSLAIPSTNFSSMDFIGLA
jgi:hypothetical protein